MSDPVKPESVPGAAGEAAAPVPPPPPPPTPEELDVLRAEAAKAKEYLDLAKRTQAEFVSWQQRARREREDLAKFAIENFLRELLPALDGLTQTLRLPSLPEGAGPLLEGVRLVEKEVLRIFAKAGVLPIEAMGRKFDPSIHEAAAVTEQEGAEDGTILEEVRRGWKIHDRVLRPAHVRISRPPARP